MRKGVKYSGALIEDDDPFEEYIKGKEITQELLKEYYAGKNKVVHLIIPLNATTSEKSRKEFVKTIDEIKC